MTLIIAEKLKKSYEWWEGNDRQLTRDEARHYFDAMINAQAPVEAEPIKHGHWIVISEYPKKAECSYCGYPIEHELVCWWDYCPNCGARMDEVEND